MKKKYMKPSMKTLSETVEELLSNSGVTGEGKVNVGYGGIDEEGTKDPEARIMIHHSLWDE